MMIRFCVITALLFAGFATGAYAAKPTVKTEAKPVVKEIVKFDFKDEIRELSKRHDDKNHIFLHIGENDNADEHHYDKHKKGQDDRANAVPVPAALWLFGSALLGLVGIKRKAA